jgi:chromosome segregation ATPase
MNLQKKSCFAKRIKQTAVVFGLLAAVLAIFSFFMARSNKSDILAFQRVNEKVNENLVAVTEQQKLALRDQVEAQRLHNVNWQNQIENVRGVTEQQKKALQEQFDAQRQQDANWQKKVEAVRDENARLRNNIESLNSKQSSFEKALETAQVAGALKQNILAKMKAIRILWSSVDDKLFYLGPDIPWEDLSRQKAHLVKDIAKMADRNANWMAHLFDHERTPDPKDNDRKKSLFCEEEKIKELLQAAKALGVIEEMPEAMKVQFANNLVMLPIRPIYRFTGEKIWWTTFQDFGELPLIPVAPPKVDNK